MAKKRKSVSKLTIVHEFDNHGQHRLVALHSEGTSQTGDWYPVSDVATILNLYANGNPGNGLPAGVFRTIDHPHQVLA